MFLLRAVALALLAAAPSALAGLGDQGASRSADTPCVGLQHRQVQGSPGVFFNPGPNTLVVGASTGTAQVALTVFLGSCTPDLLQAAISETASGHALPPVLP